MKTKKEEYQRHHFGHNSIVDMRDLYLFPSLCSYVVLSYPELWPKNANGTLSIAASKASSHYQLPSSIHYLLYSSLYLLAA
jgi:hypothetical protein